MGRNGKSLIGIPWERELVTKLGMGMGRNGNRLHGNGREWECKKPFPGSSTTQPRCGLGLDNSVSRPSRDVLTSRLWSRLGLGLKGLVHIPATQ